MLETINDYLSFIVLIFMVLVSIKILLASIRNGDSLERRRRTVTYDYINNEDE